MENYKEKYEQALARAKKLATNLPNGRNDRLYYVDDLEHIFPELKESEDKRMKETCKFYLNLQKVNSPHSVSDIDKCIAWLEKQGEQKSIIIDIDKMVDEFTHTEVKGYGMPAMIEVDAYRKGVNDVLCLSLNCEKQGEQKPAEEYNITGIGSKNAEGKLGEMIKNLKHDNEVLEQKPTDKYEGLTDFERTLADICVGWIGEELGWKQYIKDNADVLLKIAIKKFNSVQDVAFEQKPAWSEEDEKNLTSCIEAIDACYKWDKMIDWLKSLKERIGE